MMKHRNQKLLALVLGMAMLICCFAVCAAAEEATRQSKLPETISYNKNLDANESNAPKVTELENGVKVQKTPYNNACSDTQQGRADLKTVTAWNNIYLNADNRGCTACHTIEDALEMMETYHGIIYMGYETEQGIQNCFGCHSFYSDTKLRDSIHTSHQSSAIFSAMGGSCESCHYIMDDGSFARWDYVKYDVMRGFTNLSADAVSTTFEWNQTEISSHEQMYFKSVKSLPEEWIVDESQTSQEAFDNWEIVFDGDIDNPCTMTLAQLLEKYETVTTVMKSHCTVNGPGQAMIYQAEVTGIPLSAILADLGVHEDANMIDPIGDDGYYYNVSLQTALAEDAMLVVGMNGDTIYADQGWPVAFWCYEMSAGNFTKRVNHIHIYHTEGGSWDFYGDFTDCTTGRPFDKPNVAVLNATNGQIFEAGQPVHLEGYADAWNEPIVKLEYSFDKGATWQEYDIADATTHQWVYWKMDLSDLSAGAYLMKIRATSQMADGGLRVNDVLTDFYFNVQ